MAQLQKVVQVSEQPTPGCAFEVAQFASQVLAQENSTQPSWQCMAGIPGLLQAHKCNLPRYAECTVSPALKTAPPPSAHSLNSLLRQRQVRRFGLMLLLTRHLLVQHEETYYHHFAQYLQGTERLVWVFESWTLWRSSRVM